VVGAARVVRDLAVAVGDEPRYGPDAAELLRPEGVDPAGAADGAGDDLERAVLGGGGPATRGVGGGPAAGGRGTRRAGRDGGASVGRIAAGEDSRGQRHRNRDRGDCRPFRSHVATVLVCRPSAVAPS